LWQPKVTSLGTCFNGAMSTSTAIWVICVQLVYKKAGLKGLKMDLSKTQKQQQTRELQAQTEEQL